MAENIITLENLKVYKNASDAAYNALYQYKLMAGDNIKINDSTNTISATDTTYSEATNTSSGLMSASDKALLGTLNSTMPTTVNATGTSPLTLSGSIASKVITITGSVDTYNTAQINEMINTATAGGLTSVTASGNSPLTLNATQSGTAVAITGSVNLSNYVNTTTYNTLNNTVKNAYNTANNAYSQANAAYNAASSKQDKLTAGYGIDINSTNYISCTIDTSLYVVVGSLPSAPASGNENKIHLVEMSETETYNIYTEYIWVNSSWEKLGELHATTDLSDYYNKSQTNSAINTAVNSFASSFNVTASGTAPLTLSSSKSGNVVTVTGSIASATTSANGYMTSGMVTNLNSLVSSAVTTVTASGTSPLNISASISSNKLTIAGFVNSVTSSADGLMTKELYNTLTNLNTSFNTLNTSAVTKITATNNGVLNLTATNTGTGTYDISGFVNLSAYQGKLTAGNNITINSTTNTISATWPTISDLGGINNVSRSNTSTVNMNASINNTTLVINASINSSYGFATNSQLNTINNTINNAYNQANSAYTLANTANSTANSVNSNLSKYLPLAGGTMTGTITLGSSGAYITTEGHIVLASGIEIY